MYELAWFAAGTICGAMSAIALIWFTFAEERANDRRVLSGELPEFHERRERLKARYAKT